MPAAALVINEVLPDPAGTDAGHEFVEFLNTGQEPVDLEGIEFQFANGSEGPVWRTRWVGGAGQVLAPGARFLLVDRTWADTPPGDAEATLGLQNGPDAVRLARGDSVIDLVGYGALTDGALFEGRPVPLAPGLALARRPDGGDTGDNRVDFTAAEPTPGAPNFRPWSLAAVELDCEPPSLARAGDAVMVSTRLRNDGLHDWPGAALRIEAGGDQAEVRLEGWASGGERAVTVQLRPQVDGACPVTAAAMPTGADDSVRVTLGTYWVGTSALQINEAMGTPADGQGEWCELIATAGPVDLAGWSLKDEDGDWHGLPALAVGPDRPVVVAQDSAALADWLALVQERVGDDPCARVMDDGRLAGLPGWPTLNNTAPDTRTFADRLLLRDPDGVTVDHVTLGAPGGPDVPGRSLERVGAAPAGPRGLPWAVCTAAPGSTPGCPNSTRMDLGGGDGALVLAPAVLERAQGSIHVLVTVAPGDRTWRLRVYDLWGGAVRDFGGDALGPGPRDLLWDGRDDAGRPMPPGGYVVVLQRWNGTGVATERRLCAVR
ncbi:MAG TPA: lamin tail domain-containing protein [Candidatus Krumholzibacteria bacterium]|nr:lamin tail domain-containing protein [Candidatus Krumholzibacteria bacterium]